MPSDERFSFRRPYQLREQAGFGRIGTDARAPGRGTVQGLGIESIERAHLVEILTGATSYSGLSATTWTAVDTTNLSWEITTSGKRPMEFRMSAWLASASTQLMGLSLTWDGTEFSGQPYGLCGLYDSTTVRQVAGFAEIAEPGPGTHTLSVVYKVSGGSAGFVQVDTSTALFVSAKEI